MTLGMPYRDDSRTSLALTLSVLLHVLLAVAVVGFFLFKPAAPLQPAIFELVAAPPSDSPINEDPAPGPPSLSLPNLPSPATPTPPQAVEATPTPPAPTPTVVSPPPTPTPALTHTPTVAPKTPSKQPALSDYQKFLQQQKISPSTAPAHTTGRPVPNVGVNVNSIVKNLQNGGAGGSSQGRGRASGASSTEVQDYVSKLIARLQEAFVPPGGVSGLSAGIHLVIGADGTVTIKILNRPSGNADFDDAVRTALQGLTNVDPPPGGQEVKYDFTFTPKG
jgi:outer membrane biosynthesis protein TonB